MKLQINGFDIEINEDDTSLTLTVIDANGKELSNNVYTQSTEQNDVQDAEVESAEEIATDNDGVAETDTETETDTNTEDTSESETEDTSEAETEEKVEESLLMDDFSKYIKK